MTIAPAFVRRGLYRSKKRWRTSGGRLGVVSASKCRIALLETLLTFCPPGPLLRANEKCSSASGIVMVGLIWRSMGQRSFKVQGSKLGEGEVNRSLLRGAE